VLLAGAEIVTLVLSREADRAEVECMERAETSEEARTMQFMITCPVDGPIEVTIEDVDTVVLREPEQAEVIFTCPECGTEISVMVRIPSFLMAAIEAMAEEGGSQVVPIAGIVALASEIDPGDDERSDDERIEAYCEYFRRQLTDVSNAEDILREIGCGD
jgi:hypothetical protein